MARILLVGGGCRGRELARALGSEGHAVRITTRTEAGRAAIEAAGAECWIGTPDRIASLRYALEGVTIACWLLGTANPTDAEALHGTRLEFFLSQAIDTTVRGLLYEAAGSVDPQLLAGGAELVRSRAAFNEIPFRVLEVDAGGVDAWVDAARAAVFELLAL
jgi:uncharacterized protein YbjT (DUF2867 family)